MYTAEDAAGVLSTRERRDAAAADMGILRR